MEPKYCSVQRDSRPCAGEPAAAAALSSPPWTARATQLRYSITCTCSVPLKPISSSRKTEKSSPLTRAPLVQNPTVPFGRPPGTSITRRHHRNGWSWRPRGRSIDVGGHSIGRTDALLDHPCHLDDPCRVTHSSAHLVTGGHHGRRLGRPIIDPHMPTPARRGGVRPGLRQPDRPQPPIHTGRLHNIHLGFRPARGCRLSLCGSDRCSST